MRSLAFACAASLLTTLITTSCVKSPDERIIRLYAGAQDAYTAGKFLETAKMLERENKFFPAIVLRAKAEYFCGDFDKAETSCRRALRIRPSAFEAKLYLARILREKDDLTGAIELTESLLADDPQDIRALRLASELYSQAGKHGDALVFLDRASDFSAENAMALLDRARMSWVSGKKPEALEDLSRAKAMLPWDTQLLRTITNLEKTIIEAMQ